MKLEIPTHTCYITTSWQKELLDETHVSAMKNWNQEVYTEQKRIWKIFSVF